MALSAGRMAGRQHHQEITPRVPPPATAEQMFVAWALARASLRFVEWNHFGEWYRPWVLGFFELPIPGAHGLKPMLQKPIYERPSNKTNWIEADLEESLTEVPSIGTRGNGRDRLPAIQAFAFHQLQRPSV